MNIQCLLLSPPAQIFLFGRTGNPEFLCALLHSPILIIFVSSFCKTSAASYSEIHMKLGLLQIMYCELLKI